MSLIRRPAPALALVIPLTVFVLSSVIWSAPLMLNRFAWIADFFVHYQWAAQFESAIHEGFFVPRWATMSHEGLGDATFLHIHPLYYYLVTGINAVVGNLWISMKLVVVCSHIVLGCGIYGLIYRKLGRGPALLAGLSAQWLPYHFFLINYSQAFPTILAIAIAGLVLAAVFGDYPEPIWIPLVSFLIAGVVIAHILIAFTLLVSLSLSLLFSALANGTRNKRNFGFLVFWSIAAMLGLGLSGWYWIPALFGRYMINPNGWDLQLLLPQLSWNRNFIFPFITALTEGSTSVAILWLSPLPLVLISLYAAIRSKTRQVNFPIEYNREIFSIVLRASLISLFLSCGLSWPIWRLLPIFHQLQFPWRFLGVSGLASAILIGSIFGLTGLSPWPKRIAILSFICCLSATLLLAAQTFHGGKTVVADEQWLVGDFGQPEYLPSGVPATQSRKNDGKFLCRKPDERCSVMLNASHEKTYKVELGEPATIEFPIYFHPGWRATIEGKTIAVKINNTNGLVEASMPTGVNIVRIFWEGTWLEKIGAWLSVISLFLVIMSPTIVRSLPGRLPKKLSQSFYPSTAEEIRSKSSG